jgi:RimJ/RimL family protein N-acetyltransferase
MQIPEITTERLLLRGLREDDLDAYAAMMADPQVTQFLGDGKPVSRADAWRQLAMLLGHWHLRGFGLWAVEDRATGVFLGRIGCHQPEGWPAFEIGYTLASHAWGRGIAHEAAGASLKYAREVLGKTEIISIIRPDNHRSIRVATSLGAAAAETIEFFGAPAALYRYPER